MNNNSKPIENDQYLATRAKYNEITRNSRSKSKDKYRILQLNNFRPYSILFSILLTVITLPIDLPLEIDYDEAYTFG
jgi:hypothetical protein